MAKVGDFFHYGAEDQRYECVDVAKEVALKTSDREFSKFGHRTGFASVWSSTCAEKDCNNTFEITFPVKFPCGSVYYLNRRCSAHIKPGVAVSGSGASRLPAYLAPYGEPDRAAVQSIVSDATTPMRAGEVAAALLYATKDRRSYASSQEKRALDIRVKVALEFLTEQGAIERRGEEGAHRWWRPDHEWPAASVPDGAHLARLNDYRAMSKDEKRKVRSENAHVREAAFEEVEELLRLHKKLSIGQIMEGLRSRPLDEAVRKIMGFETRNDKVARSYMYTLLSNMRKEGVLVRTGGLADSMWAISPHKAPVPKMAEVTTGSADPISEEQRVGALLWFIEKYQFSGTSEQLARQVIEIYGRDAADKDNYEYFYDFIALYGNPFALFADKVDQLLKAAAKYPKLARICVPVEGVDGIVYWRGYTAPR